MPWPTWGRRAGGWALLRAAACAGAATAAACAFNGLLHDVCAANHLCKSPLGAQRVVDAIVELTGLRSPFWLTTRGLGLDRSAGQAFATESQACCMPLDVPRGTPKAPLVEVEDLPSWATVHHHVRELSPKTEETPSNVKPFGRIPVGGFPVGAPPILVPRPLASVRHVRWTTADHGEQDATKFGWKGDLVAKIFVGIPMDSSRRQSTAT